MSGGHYGRPVTATVLTSHLPRWVSLTGRPWVHPPLGQTGLPAIQEGTGHGEVPAERLYPPPPRHPCTSMLGCPPCILDRGRHLGLEGAVLIPPKPAQSCTPWDSQHGCPTHRGRDACIQLTSNFNTQPPRDPESHDAPPGTPRAVMLGDLSPLPLRSEDRNGHGPAHPSASE